MSTMALDLARPPFLLGRRTDLEDDDGWYQSVLEMRPDGSLFPIGTVGFWRGVFMVKVSPERLAHAPIRGDASRLIGHETTFWGALKRILKDFAL